MKPKETAITVNLLQGILSGILRMQGVNRLSEFILHINPENPMARETKLYMLMMNVWFMKLLCEGVKYLLLEMLN